MHSLLLTVVVLLVVLFLLWPVAARKWRRPPSEPAPAPVPRQSSVAVRTGTTVPDAAPPGTADLDDVDAVRPEISAGVLATARSGVTQAVPDGVLADALLDATPDQLRNLFASVSADVIAAAVGPRRDDVQSQPVKAEELALLRGAGDAVDELDIWSFADKK